MRFDFIDGMRGVAILSVLACHMVNFVVGVTTNVSLTARYLLAGKYGVQLFFLLSAFALFHSSRERFQTESSPVRNFYLRRAFRILPLWWLSLFAYEGYPGDGKFLANALMYFGFFRFDRIEYNHVQWTLFVEETFYLIFPLVVGWLISLRRALLAFLAGCVLTSLWLALAERFGVPTAREFIARFPLAHFHAFGFGILLYFVYANGWMERWNAHGTRRGIAVALTAVALMLIPYLKPSLVVFPLGALLLLSADARTPFGWLARFSVLKKFGVCCYSIYLFHLILIRYTAPFVRWWMTTLDLYYGPLELQFLAWFPLFAGLCLTLGLGSYWAFEKPCIAVGARFIRWLEERNVKRYQVPFGKVPGTF